jgi:hypothetical protein
MSFVFNDIAEAIVSTHPIGRCGTAARHLPEAINDLFSEQLQLHFNPDARLGSHQSIIIAGLTIPFGEYRSGPSGADGRPGAGSPLAMAMIRALRAA